MKTKQVVAVIVGRFQTPELHDGHRHVIDIAKRRGRKLLIAVGVSGGAISKIDPMDFETRAAMIKSEYPEAVVVMIKDHSVDKAWSATLDELIKKNFPHHHAILFGSRDSFLPHYGGKHQKREVKPQIDICATDCRHRVGQKPLNSTDFRAGVIYASAKQGFPTSFQTVDVVVKHSTENKVLVGRKTGEEGWRFPGGFVDPTDISLEYAAKREVTEEVDIEIADVKYICSTQIDDHRYRKSEHQIMTALFSAIYVYGSLRAHDDLEEVRWQEVDDNFLDCLITSHKRLGKAYLDIVRR